MLQARFLQKDELREPAESNVALEDGLIQAFDILTVLSDIFSCSNIRIHTPSRSIRPSISKWLDFGLNRSLLHIITRQF